MNILVTGGAGAVGSNLSRLLVNKGYNVTVIDDLSSGFLSNLIDIKVDFIEKSILDESILENLFAAKKFTYVFHLAAFFANQNSVEHPRQDCIVNGLGTLKILESSLKHGIKKIIYISSSCVYGRISQMHEEASLPVGKLDTPYAITKLLGEQYCQFFANHYGLNTVSVRLFNSYGPGERPGKYRNVIPNFFDRALKKDPLIITGTGSETRDFTFVEDAVSGMYKICFSHSKPGDIINLGSGIKTSILDVAKMINKISGNQTPIVFKPKRNWDCIENRVANIEKIKSITDYEPMYKVEDGLLLTYKWHLKNG